MHYHLTALPPWLVEWGLFLWAASAAALGFIARWYGRNAAKWTLLAVALSPLIAALILIGRVSLPRVVGESGYRHLARAATGAGTAVLVAIMTFVLWRIS